MDNDVNAKVNTISVCICTYMRPFLLENIVKKLETQILHSSFMFDVVFVDNDPMRSAEAEVAKIKKSSELDIHYYHEKRRSISYARNRCIEEATGDFIAFIDDDEFPTDRWLKLLFDTIVEYAADGVLGPVEPFYDNRVPSWLPKSKLLNRERLSTGYIINNSKYTRTGNVIFKKNIFVGLDEPFDPKYGIIGGGDVEFFERMLEKKKKFIWCDEAIVYEHIEEKRRKKSYYIKRAFTRGLTNSMKYPFFKGGTFKSLLAVLIYLFVVPISVIFGQGQMMKYSVKFCDHLGKILGYMGVKVVKERPY